MQRVIEPEILDELPADDPRAVWSRRDLRRINAWMGNARLLSRWIASLPRPPRTIVELGTGDGRLILGLARRLQRLHSAPLSLFLLDRQPVVRADTLESFRALGCRVELVQADLHDWIQAPAPESDLILANLFLHHFREPDLRKFFAAFSQRTAALISCDPRRWKPSLLATRFLWAIACNRVTRHDAFVSVRAGFRDQELSALWPPDSGFALREGPGGFASHLFCAFKPAGAAPL